jgi:heme exporter protein C
MRKPSWVPNLFLVIGVAMLAVGAYLGLKWAPPDREMGDVQRIMYVHVPSVWMALLATTLNFGASVAYLVKRSWRSDSLAEAGAELGVVFGGLGVLLGAIWGKPTWGVWWDWDPRLTTAAIMLVTYAGYLALRRFVDDADKRAAWSAVVAIISYANIPLVWYSVRWWRSLHQVQSTPRTVDPDMTFVLRFNAFAFLALLICFLWRRYEIAHAARLEETALPEPGPGGAGTARGLMP